MKKLATWILIALVAFSVSACASMGSGSGTKVKCPSCGYEFEVPKTR